jgi:hypothetical protein
MITSIRLPKFTHEKERKQKFSPFFAVNEIDLVRADNGEKMGVRALINAETNKKVGVVTDRYKLVTHETASNLVKNILIKAQINYESKGAYVSNGGSRFFETLLFPDLAFNPAGELGISTALDNYGMKKDDYIPAITMMNSYDKSRPVVFAYGMYRLICTNGAILPIRQTKLSFKHTQEVDVERVRTELMRNLEDSKVLMSRVYEKLNAEPGLDYLGKVLTAGFSAKFKKTLLDKLNASDKSYHVEYDEETDPVTGRPVALHVKSITTQASAYAIYNVVTDIASHTLTNRSERETANTHIAKLFIPAK